MSSPSTRSPTSPTPTPPPLKLLTTLSTPSSHGTRAWSSSPHPSQSTPFLATASSDKSAYIWSLRDFTLLSAVSGGHKRSVRCVGWKDWGHRDGRGVNEGGNRGELGGKVTLATGSFDANVGIWEYNPRKGRDIDVGEGDGDGVDGTDDGDQIMRDSDIETDLTHDGDGGDENGDDDEEWRFTSLLTGQDSEIKGLAFSPPHYSANLLASSSRDKTVWVWEEVEDGEWETIAVGSEHTGDVKCVAWCEGGRMPKRRKIGHGEQHKQNGTDQDEIEDDEEEEDRIFGSREILASGSYDDTIRLWRDVEEEGDWICVGVMDGHAGTVWSVSWEKYINTTLFPDHDKTQIASEWEPRLLSCSDDLTIRLWRRELSESEKEKKRNHLANGVPQTSAQSRLPSIIRPQSNFEKWTQETVLPQLHVRSVYAVDWSRHTGLVVSCGGDGTIAVYQEIPVSSSSSFSADQTSISRGPQEPQGPRETQNDVQMNDPSNAPSNPPKSKWITIATVEAAHDEYEVNHVCWALRRDKERRFDGEEVIVSTGDDGDVKVWVLPDGVGR